jgi:hypothetical protein
VTIVQDWQHRKGHTRMFHWRTELVLGIGAAAALIAGMAGPVNAGPTARLDDIGAVAAPAGVAAGGGRYVDITGTIAWKQTLKVPWATGGSGDTTTGTFYINLTQQGPGYTVVVNKSTYSVVDNVDYITVSPTTNGNCTDTITGHYSSSGALHWAGSSPFVVLQQSPPYQKITQLYIVDDYTEKQTSTVTGPAECQPGSTSHTAEGEALPTCFKNMTSTLITGTFRGKFPEGTANVGCAGKETFGSGGPTYTYSISGILAYTTPCAPPKELSGPSWTEKFPDSSKIADLSPSFRADVTRFKDAMEHAEIAVHVISTLRPLERAYLMHYSWLIAKLQQAPATVPPFEPGPGQSDVNICWLHTDANGSADLAASIDAAQKMVTDFHIDPKLNLAPALKSRHTEGLAIDMTTTWNKSTIKIVNDSGHKVTINTVPHGGLNTQLMEVGATYDVFHFCYPSGTCHSYGPSDDPNHWSSDGH